MLVQRLCVAIAASLLSACNMVLSETPMFTEGDRASLAPRDGIWLGEDDECPFDSSTPESGWPECAMWVVVRSSGRELNITDGKGQAEQIGGFFAAGDPTILQARWVDSAKDSRAYYGFYGIEPDDAGLGGQFSTVSVWPVECGIQESPNAEIRPYPGIGPECRPASKDAIRSAAKLSRRSNQITRWRWLRSEAPKD